MADRGRRPGVFQVGTVKAAGTHLVLQGWGLALCLAECPCHRSPGGGHLVMVEDVGVGTLGLKSFRPGCGCCEPWTVEELASVLHDLAAVVDWLEAQPG